LILVKTAVKATLHYLVHNYSATKTTVFLFPLIDMVEIILGLFILTIENDSLINKVTQIFITKLIYIFFESAIKLISACNTF
jgi:hypothetical protein